ncbi:hypothetical protein Tco_1262419 [Tanacetum coccineum]
MDKQASEEQPINEQVEINQPDKVQAERSVPKPQVEKPATTLISPKSKKPEAQAGTNVILKRLTKLETKVEAMSKFNLPEAIDESVQAHLKKNLPKDISDFINSNKRKLPKPVKAEIQSIVEVPFLQEKLADQRPPLVDTTMTMLQEKTTQPPQPPQSRRKTKVEAMSKFNLPEAIDKSVQAHLRKNLPKDVPHFGKIKQEKAAKQSMPKYSTKPFDEASLKEYDQKDKLIKLMIKSKRHDDQDPSTDADKETKKRKRKDSNASSSKKSKNKEESSKGTKAPFEPSSTQKAMDGDELIQNGVMDDIEMAQDDDIAVDAMPHDDSPTQDKSKWFKQDVVVGPETPDPEWCKEPNADDAPKQNWFNEMVNAEKDPLTFDDLMGSTVDFTKFAKHCL